MNIRSTPLDQLTVTVVVDNETDNLSSIDEGIPQRSEVVSLLGRTPATRQHDGHDCIPVFDRLCVACHGFSVLLTGLAGNERHSVLFDVGPYGDVWVDNADRLGIDLPEDRDYATVAGLALAVFRHLPGEGESFVEQGWKFEIVDLDGRRIDKLLVSEV